MIIAVRVRPKSGRNAVLGRSVDNAGRAVLQVCVTAAPHDGAANLAVQGILAEWLGVPKTALRLYQGAKSRYKQFELSPTCSTLSARVMALLSGEQPK